MDIFRLVQDIKTHLKLSFDEVDKWFEKDEKTLNALPANGVGRFNRFWNIFTLPTFICSFSLKKDQKAMRNYLELDLNSEIKNYSFDNEKFEKVGEHGAFEWIRPEHMEPKGELSLSEIRNLMSQQYDQCLSYLDLMKNGEGLLCKTTMTVNGLGKINGYEYIYFLSLHAQRHLTQMRKNESETIKN